MFALQVAMVKGHGGISAAALHYARMFEAAGVDAALLYRGPASDYFTQAGVDVIAAPAALASPLGVLIPMPALKRAVVARGALELVVVHSDRALPALRAMFPRARFVTPCHSDNFKHKARADLVVTLNARQQQMARAALPRTRCAQLGNPYVCVGAPQARLAGAPRLNFVGRFIEAKAPDILLRAAALAEIDAPLRFIGAGPLEVALREQANALGVRAEFAGWLSAPFTHFHAGDILVAPSVWEGLPYLLLEALEHRTPIVASDIAGNRAALAGGDFGALFPVGDEAALASALRAGLAQLDALRAKSEKGAAALEARHGAVAFWRALSRELELTHV